MSEQTLEERVAALEERVADLERRLLFLERRPFACPHCGAVRVRTGRMGAKCPACGR